MSTIERRHGYQQLGDSHNYDTWRLRNELLVKRKDDSSSCLVSPPLADTFSAVQCPSFLLVIFQGRKQDISIAICLYFPALFCLTHTPYHPVVSWLISAENEMLLQLQWSSMFQALLVDALFFSPSGNFKNQASIVAYVHLHKIDMLEYPKIPQRLDDHIPASTDAFASSTEGSTGLASQSVGQPWRAKWAYWIWWGNSMFADVCVCFGRFEILECVQCLVQVTCEVVGYNALVKFW